MVLGAGLARRGSPDPAEVVTAGLPFILRPVVLPGAEEETYRSVPVRGRETRTAIADRAQR